MWFCKILDSDRKVKHILDSSSLHTFCKLFLCFSIKNINEKLAGQDTDHNYKNAWANISSIFRKECAYAYDIYTYTEI